VISRHATSRPLTETLLKKLEERKISLREKERELGDDHPDTLHAMENLSCIL
jgi:hypothetical protein